MFLVKLLAIFSTPQKFSHSYNKELVAQNLLVNSLSKHHPKTTISHRAPLNKRRPGWPKTMRAQERQDLKVQPAGALEKE